MRSTFVALALAAGAVLATPGAPAQVAPDTARPASIPAETDPERAVSAALAGQRPLQRQGARHAGTAPRDWTVALHTTRGQCYELVAVAAGSHRVTAEVRARRARLGEPLSLATSSGVARTRFCATLPGRAYAVAVHADGATRWALALRPAPVEPPAPPPPDPGAGQRDRLAAALASNNARTPEGVTITGEQTADAGGAIPVGGTENDYVGTQLRAFVRSRPGARPLIAAIRANLATNQTREVPLSLQGGQCVELVVAGVPSVTDVNLELFDPAGNRVADEHQHAALENLHYCAAYTGSYRLTVRMFAGSGLTGIQAFEVR
jgi:hypothetical protein